VWADFHFLRPLWLLLPLIALLLVRLMPRSGGYASAWRSQVDPALSPWVLVRLDGASRGRWPILLLLTLIGFVCAGPAWERVARPQVASGHALVIALDLSRSMLAEDLRPNRLIRARFKLEELFDGRLEGQTGLLVYAADAFLVAPLTNDLGTLRLQLPVLEPDLMPAQGSRADRAYERAVQLLDAGGFPDGEVLLVTDGIDPGQVAVLESLCARHGNRLSILAAATEAGAPVPGLRPGAALVISRLDRDLTAGVARACGGEAVLLGPDDADIRQLEAAFRNRAGDTASRDAGLDAFEWVDRGPWLLLALLPWLAFHMRLQAGNVLLLGIALSATPTPGLASDNDAWWLWQHADERGRERLQAGDAAGAAATFQDPRWKAWAAVQAGDLAQALTLLAPMEDVGSLYNRGTTLAQLGRLEEALQVLETALTRDPTHADARFNHRLIEERLAAEQKEAPGEPGREGEPQSQGDAVDESRQDARQTSRPQSEGSESPPGQAGTDPPPANGGESPQATPPAEDPTDPGDAGHADAAARESAQATEQWLARIPDDPGGLLRNKFLHQYQRRRDTDPADEEAPW